MKHSPSGLRLVLTTLVTATLLACAANRDEGPGEVVALREGAAASTDPSAETDIQMRTLVSDLQEPWGMDFLPDGRLLVTEQGGALKLIEMDNFSSSEVEGVPESVMAGQGGLLDVLVHPDFSRNKWVYLSYTVSRDEQYSTRVTRARLMDGRLQDHEDLFTAEPYFAERRHFGSRLLLDGGYLYITVGDRGNRDLAQSLASHNGKVLRLTESGKVPPGNPFVLQDDARPEIWTYGHRNPQGLARHPHNGSIWITEHGPQGGDELNVLERGANYGWPLVTYGEEYGGGAIGQGTHRDGTEQPLVYWVPSIGTGNIAFYDGDVYPGWRDSLLVAALKLTRISRLELEAAGVGTETRLLANLGMRFRDVQQGPDGLVYALAGGKRLVRLEIAGAD